MTIAGNFVRNFTRCANNFEVIWVIHTSGRNATVNVIEGQGVLTLEGKEIVLELGVFVFVPANARHAFKAVTNLAFLLTLSEQTADSNQ
jgi:quercetin dioxygenase-like cupin family protein